MHPENTIKKLISKLNCADIWIILLYIAKQYNRLKGYRLFNCASD